MAKKAKKKRKKSSKVTVKVIIKKAPSKREFVLTNGTKVKDLRELALALGDISDEVFWHHVNDSRNDFVNWVNGVFKDKELARQLGQARDKVNAQVTILKHLVRKIS